MPKQYTRKSNIPYKSSGSSKKAKPKMDNKRKAKIIMAVVVVLILIGVGIYLTVQNLNPNFSSENVILSIDGPSQIASGKDTTYTVKYLNNEGVALNNVEIQVQYPAGFEVSATSPEAKESNSLWQIEELRPLQSGSIEISGKLFGEVNDRQNIKVTMSYLPGNLSSSFTTETEISTAISQSALTMEITTPENSPSGSSLSFSVALTNDLEEELDDIRLRFSYPENFTYTSSEPNASLENNIFDIAKLNSDESSTIAVSGDLTGDEGDVQKFVATLEVKQADGNYVVQAAEEFSVTIVKPALTLTQTVNDGDSANVSAGDELEYKITYKNEGDVTLQNVEITEEFNRSDLYDATTFVSEPGTLVDNKVTFSEIATIEPNAEETLSFKINLKDTLPSATNGLQLLGKARVSAGTVQDGEATITSESDTITVSIAGSISLVTEGHYYDYEGIQLGTGPIPPKVGKTTTYRIYWFVSSGVDKLNNAKVTTILPAGVKFVGTTTAEQGTITYEAATRQITWDIGILKNSSSVIREMEGTFTLSITPNEAGSLVTLLNGSTFTATDDATDDSLSDPSGLVDTDLADDIYATDDGVVID
ncbi:MAG: hypothetical protein ABIE68_04540 [bacterium]